MDQAQYYTLLTQLRHQLHRNPELSGQETKTVGHIRAFIQHHHPPAMWVEGLGGTGIAAIYESPVPGPSILIRCELDALPIPESLDLPYASRQAHVSHKCGHDGHMSIVAGLALWLKQEPLPSGRLILLFQPAEETGQGAKAVLADDRFSSLIRPDYCFALHNLPGLPLHQVLWVPQSFSASVISLAIHLQGRLTHAAAPEKGRNPALAIAGITQALMALTQSKPQQEDFCLITPIYTRMGQLAYGTAAGEGELHFTIRTWSEQNLEIIRESIQQTIVRSCRSYGLHPRWEWLEHFPASVNDSFCNEQIRKAAHTLGLSIQEAVHPCKFGEDFGWLSQAAPGAMFGLGAGEQTPALHHPEYDFPDALLSTGTQLFQQIIRQLLSGRRA